MANTGNNQPGLAKFTHTFLNYGYERYTSIRMLPYSGKVAQYINQIKDLPQTLNTLCSDINAVASLECETMDFESYAEAKAAGLGARFLGCEGFLGYSDMREATAKDMQDAVRVIKNHVDVLENQEKDSKYISEHDIPAVMNDIASKTGLW